MDPFVVVMLGLVGGLFVFVLLLGKFYPGSGADVIDWKPTRSAETEVQNEIDDLDQMLEAANRRRRAKGRPELTEDSVRMGLDAEVRERIKTRDDYVADLEVVQMLEAKNARRRAKGLPEISEADYRAKILGEAPAAGRPQQ